MEDKKDEIKEQQAKSKEELKDASLDGVNGGKIDITAGTKSSDFFDKVTR